MKNLNWENNIRFLYYFLLELGFFYNFLILLDSPIYLFFQHFGPFFFLPFVLLSNYYYYYYYY